MVSDKLDKEKEIVRLLLTDPDKWEQLILYRKVILAYGEGLDYCWFVAWVAPIPLLGTYLVVDVGDKQLFKHKITKEEYKRVKIFAKNNAKKNIIKNDEEQELRRQKLIDMLYEALKK